MRFAGAGLGYRLPVHPCFRRDSAVNISLTYEAGYRWFKGTGHTSAEYGVPKDTYEGRIHFRIRADALKRNLMELPHGDSPWAAMWCMVIGRGGINGERPFQLSDFKKEQTHIQASALCPYWLRDCRHSSRATSTVC